MKKLFVSNLSFNANDNDLAAAFEPYGTIEESKIITDRETGRARGFGFVTFADPTEAQAAIKGLHETEFMGRPLKVEIAQERPKTNNRTSNYNNDRNRTSRY